MFVTITFQCEPESVKFLSRRISVHENEEILVGRAGKSLRPTCSNAIFDSKVLSKHHSVITFEDGKVFIADCGSSNGTFINNSRLSSSNQKSSKIEMFSQDIIRFGSSIVDKTSKRSVEKCVICKISLSSGDETELTTRPGNKRLDIDSIEKGSFRKQVSFKDGDTYNSEVDILIKRLKEKENEVLNLEKNLAESKKLEKNFRSQVSQMEVQLEKSFCQCDNVKSNETTLEQCDILQENSFFQKGTQEQMKSYRQQLDKKYKEELHNQSVELDRLRLLVDEAEDIYFEKDLEIAKLNEQIIKDQEGLQERENNFLNLKCLMTEENETVHQIECEMQRLLNIITNDQDLLRKKDDQITELQKKLKSNREANSISHIDKYETQSYIEEMMLEKDLELQTLSEEKDYELFNSKLELKNKQTLIQDYEEEIESLKNTINQQTELSMVHEILKSKIGELMKIIEKQNEQISQFSEKQNCQETISQRNEILQKEIHVLKVTIQQKDLDIKSLNHLLESKDEALKELNDFESKVQELKSTLYEQFKIQIQEKDEQISTHLKRLSDEQKSHKQTEDELIMLKLNIQEKETSTTLAQSVTNSEDVNQNTIQALKDQLHQEQQISSHLTIVQEQEIIEKEKEILSLKTMLQKFTKQSQILLEMDEISSDDTLTFHDALSDEENEDVLLEDFDLE